MYMHVCLLLHVPSSIASHLQLRFEAMMDLKVFGRLVEAIRIPLLSSYPPLRLSFHILLVQYVLQQLSALSDASLGDSCVDF